MREAIDAPPQFEAGSPLVQGWQNGKGRFLIDGFPRKMDQALKFDQAVSTDQRVSALQLPDTECRCASRLSCCSSRRPRRSCSSVSSSGARPLAETTTTASPSRSDSVSDTAHEGCMRQADDAQGLSRRPQCLWSTTTASRARSSR